MDKGVQMLIIVIGVIVGLALHHFLSTRKNWLLGGIFPLCYTGFAIWVMATKDVGLYNTIKLVILLIFLLAIWGVGRDKVKNRLAKEIEKMKSKDIS